MQSLPVASRWSRRCSASVYYLIIASLALLLPFDDQVKRFVAERFGEPAGELVSGLAPFPSVVVLFAGLFWLERKSKKIPELSCPACKKFIGGMRYLIVATKCCPHCGVRILNDVD